MTRKVAIVEDHGLIANAVAAALERRGTAVHVLDLEATTDPVAEVVSVSPDLALLDLDLGARGTSLPMVGPLRAAGIPAVMVTGVTDRIRLARCVEAGAVGVLSKDVSFDELIAAIDRALGEGTLLSKHEREEHLATLRTHERSERDRLAAFESLTPREAEVLGALAAGRSVDDIAKASFVSVATVRTQVRSILSKLGVSSQLAAIAKAHAEGWQPPSMD